MRWCKASVRSIFAFALNLSARVKVASRSCLTVNGLPSGSDLFRKSQIYCSSFARASASSESRLKLARHADVTISKLYWTKRRGSYVYDSFIGRHRRIKGFVTSEARSLCRARLGRMSFGELRRSHTATECMNDQNKRMVWSTLVTFRNLAYYMSKDHADHDHDRPEESIVYPVKMRMRW